MTVLVINSQHLSDPTRMPLVYFWLSMRPSHTSGTKYDFDITTDRGWKMALKLDGLMAIGVLQQSQPSTDDFTDVVVAADFDLVADQAPRTQVVSSDPVHRAVWLPLATGQTWSACPARVVRHCQAAFPDAAPSRLTRRYVRPAPSARSGGKRPNY